jgi:hypothetical protein
MRSMGLRESQHPTRRKGGRWLRASTGNAVMDIDTPPSTAQQRQAYSEPRFLLPLLLNGGVRAKDDRRGPGTTHDLQPECCLAGARRPPQYEGGKLVRFYRPPQECARSDKVLLARKFVKRARAHPDKPRPRGFRVAPEAGLRATTVGFAKDRLRQSAKRVEDAEDRDRPTASLALRGGR